MVFGSFLYKENKNLPFRSPLVNAATSISLQQNVFLVTKISEEIFFVAKSIALVTKYFVTVGIAIDSISDENPFVAIRKNQRRKKFVTKNNNSFALICF